MEAVKDIEAMIEEKNVGGAVKIESVRVWDRNRGDLVGWVWPDVYEDFLKDPEDAWKEKLRLMHWSKPGESTLPPWRH